MDIELLKSYLERLDKEQDPQRYSILERLIREETALQILPWETINMIRRANGYSLYPLDWPKIKTNCLEKYGKELDFEQTEFESRLKERCDGLNGWGLYEVCPECSIGIKIPVWNGWKQKTMFCGCSHYPFCGFSIDRAW